LVAFKNENEDPPLSATIPNDDSEEPKPFGFGALPAPNPPKVGVEVEPLLALKPPPLPNPGLPPPAAPLCPCDDALFKNEKFIK
jgi:hypothetical protein